MAGNAVGLDCYLYYNAGTYSSPTWTLVSEAKDVSANVDKNYGDVSSRASRWKKEKPALKSFELAFGYAYKAAATDAVFAALRAAAYADTPMEFWVADGIAATVGTQGPRAYVDLSMNLNQALEDGVAADFTGKLTPKNDSGTEREPTWYTAA